MAKSVFVRPQSLLFLALFALASCGVRSDADSDAPAVAAPVVNNSGISGTPTTVVGETPVTAPVVAAPAVPSAPETPTTPVVVVPTPGTPATPETPTTPVIVVPTPETPTTPPVVVQPAPTTSWAIVSAQFFTPNCVRCHGASGGVNLETYDSAKNFLEEIRAAVLVDKSMPPRKTLPTATTDILKAWLDAGAPQ